LLSNDNNKDGLKRIWVITNNFLNAYELNLPVSRELEQVLENKQVYVTLIEK
jgi:hypothetical protein